MQDHEGGTSPMVGAKDGSWVLRDLQLVERGHTGAASNFIRRGALAGCLATEAAEQEVDMRSSLVLYRNRDDGSHLSAV